MRGRRGTFFWNLLFSYFPVIYSIISGFVLVPYYLKFIGPTIYGSWLALGNILTWISLVDPGFASLLLQKVGFAFGKRENDITGKYIGSGIVIGIAISGLVYAIGSITNNYFYTWLNIEQTDLDLHVLEKAFKIALLGTSLSLFSFF